VIESSTICNTRTSLRFCNRASSATANASRNRFSARKRERKEEGRELPIHRGQWNFSPFNYIPKKRASATQVQATTMAAAAAAAEAAPTRFVSYIDCLIGGGVGECPWTYVLILCFAFAGCAVVICCCCTYTLL
jgi:hypothetical protein